MTTDLAARVQQRLNELGLSAREVSLAATGSDGTVRMILTGASQNPRGDTIRKLASVLKVSEQWLLTGDEADASNQTGELRPAPMPPAVSAGELPKDVPVYGTVAGGELGKGAFQLTSDVVDYVRRPYGLLGAADVYALYVEGESMVPKFEPGDLVFVHPHRKPRGGDYVVIQEPDSDNGGPRGFIKRLVTFAGSKIRTEQFNPPATIEFINRPGVIVHKVMSDAELFGL